MLFGGKEKKKKEPWILLIDKSLCSPKGVLVHLSSWQVETQRLKEAEAPPKGPQPRHILHRDPAICEFTQVQTSTLPGRVSNPAVTKQSMRGQGYPSAFLINVAKPLICQRKIFQIYHNLWYCSSFYVEQIEKKMSRFSQCLRGSGCARRPSQQFSKASPFLSSFLHWRTWGTDTLSHLPS